MPLRGASASEVSCRMFPLAENMTFKTPSKGIGAARRERTGQRRAWTAPHLPAGSTTRPQARPGGRGCGSRRGVGPGGAGVSSPGLEPRHNPLGTGVSDCALTLPLAGVRGSAPHRGPSPMALAGEGSCGGGGSSWRLGLPASSLGLPELSPRLPWWGCSVLGALGRGAESGNF